MAYGINKIFLQLSTLGPIGYLKAPGTMATLVTLPLLVILQSFAISLPLYTFFLLISTIGAFFIVQRSLSFFSSKDPSEIVIDEYIGCLITFYGLPLYASSLIAGFIFFRFFDIVKCFGIRSCEKIGGAWGVMLDDMLAGFFANVCLHVLLLLFYDTF